MVKFAGGAKKYMVEKNISFLKMKYNGDEILAYVLQGDKDDDNLPEHYYLFKPVKISSYIDPVSGTIRMLLTEYISSQMSDDEGFEIKSADVLITASVTRNLKTTYVSFCSQMTSMPDDGTGEITPVKFQKVGKNTIN